MPNLLDQKIQKAEKARRAAQKVKDDDDRAQAAKIAARKAETAAKLETRRIVGRAIMDAIESGDITPHQLSAVEEVLAKVKERTANWVLLYEHFPAISPEKHQPANDPELEKRQPEFVRTGK